LRLFSFGGYGLALAALALSNAPIMCKGFSFRLCSLQQPNIRFVINIYWEIKALVVFKKKSADLKSMIYHSQRFIKDLLQLQVNQAYSLS